MLQRLLQSTMDTVQCTRQGIMHFEGKYLDMWIFLIELCCLILTDTRKSVNYKQTNMRQCQQRNKRETAPSHSILRPWLQDQVSFSKTLVRAAQPAALHLKTVPWTLPGVRLLERLACFALSGLRQDFAWTAPLTLPGSPSLTVPGQRPGLRLGCALERLALIASPRNQTTRLFNC